ncbi:MAG: SH3 domain-containing protein [Lachnospiraceae bacterium]|nr:SH3 domain-containing protein [Lachnospiraceae bacterium]
MIRYLMLPVMITVLVMTGSNSTYAYTAVKGTVTCQSGKVRKEASTNSSFAFGVRKDEEVTIVDEKKGNDGKVWYQIKIGAATGYIRSDLINKSKTKVKTENVSGDETSKTSSDSGGSKTADGVVIVDIAIMRHEASQKAEIEKCLKQNSEVKVAGAVAGDDGKTWYLVNYSQGGVTYRGYIRSDLLKVNGKVATIQSEQKEQENTTVTAKTPGAEGDTQSEATTVQIGKIKGYGINVRKTSVDGEVICRVSQGQIVTVTEQTAGGDGKVWYKISFINNLTPQTGYIRADYVDGVTQTVVAKEAAESGDSVSGLRENDNNGQVQDTEGDELQNTGEGSDTDDYEPHAGAVNGINVNVRKEPVNGEIVTWLSTGSTVTVINERSVEDGKIWYNISYKFNNDEYKGWILSDYVKTEENTSDYSEALTGLVKGSGIRIRESAVNGTVVEQLSSGHRLNILGEVMGSDEQKWYYVDFTCKGTEKKGYIRSDLVHVIATEGSTKPSADVDFEQSISSLPESYKAGLRTLHEKYPNWRFETVDTGLDWNESIAAECSVGKNLVAYNSISSWKSTVPQAYNWNQNIWYRFDGGSWAAASAELISYYMDPRNFLNESGIFQFELLDNLDYQNEQGVANIIKGSFLDSEFIDTDGAPRSYVSVITETARATGISPYHLATRILQEQGLYGRSQSISGTVGGYEGVFNYFNIGAYEANGRGPIINGLIYASKYDEEFFRPWNSRYKSILGSAKYLSDKYVKKGQNTLYFEKFNVVNRENGIYKHQYMSNIQAASSESAKMRKAYSDMNTTLVFRIPYYYNMPEAPCEKPTGESNPNNYLSGLSVDGMVIAPQFNSAVDTYYLTVDNSVTSINISASPVAATSVVGGAGIVNLEVGTNTILIVCKAQNGNIRTYTLYVQRNL